MPATVERIEYDPNRTAFIALIKYQDGELAYILAPQRVGAGDQVIASENADVKPAIAMPIANIRSDCRYTISRSDRQGSARSRVRPAATPRSSARPGLRHPAAQFREQRLVHGRCMATIGAVSNFDDIDATMEELVASAERRAGIRTTAHHHGTWSITRRVERQRRQDRWTTPWLPGPEGKNAQEPAHHPDSSLPPAPTARAAGLRITGVMSRWFWKSPFINGYLLAEQRPRARRAVAE